MNQPKVETTKKLSGFSRPSQFASIYFILFNFITIRAELERNVTIGKCCPHGQVIFSSPEKYTCGYNSERKQELYPLRSRGIRDETLSSCDKSISRTLRIIHQECEVIPTRNTCVDLWHVNNENFNGTVPVVFKCYRGSNGTAHYEGIGPEDWKLTRFMTLRMCCGKNRYFDRELRECKMRRKKVNDQSFLNFLRRDFDFVNILVGPPVCKHAIVDYIVNATTDVRVLSEGKMRVRNFLITRIRCFSIQLRKQKLHLLLVSKDIV